MATQDQELKAKYSDDCAKDHSECCRNKKRRDKIESKKKEVKNDEKKEAELSAKKATAAVISKIPPTIQVKKFASINIDDTKSEKKASKRSLSPKSKPVFLKTPIAVQSNTKTYGSFPSMPKKIRMSTSHNIVNPIRFLGDRSKPMNTNPIRIRPKTLTQIPMPVMTPFNGFNNMPSYNNFINDNINLSLESLTQGLDMAAVASMNNNAQEDDVVCTPDFPMEPLCEVTEDNADDDVQCITPMGNNRVSQPPPLVPRSTNALPDLSADNIIQMTENDVTVNAQTGGLKFRVDPQTLSSNKMYRLPDGRIFAINANPNMPGGYSATIVAVTETAAKNTPKGSTYAAKLSAVPNQTPSPVSKPNRTPVPRPVSAKRVSKTNTAKVTRATETVIRDCDLEVPVEWYRYNLIDAVDALDYSLSRLNKLKKDATTVHLRTRSISEMRSLHKTVERLLHTSTVRFNEIRDNLNKGFKQYLAKKTGNNSTSNISDDDDDDDDVEILPNPGDNDDPIFIDENSVDSNANSIDQQEVDLTGGLSNSELNDSGDKSIEMLDENFLKTTEEMEEKSSEKNGATSKSDEVDPLGELETGKGDKNSEHNGKENSLKSSEVDLEKADSEQNHNNDNSASQTEKVNLDDGRNPNDKDNEEEESTGNGKSSKEGESAGNESSPAKTGNESPKATENKSINGAEEPMDVDSKLKKEDQISTTSAEKSGVKTPPNVPFDKKNVSQDDEKIQDAEMSEEMIETLLKGDEGENDDDTNTVDNSEIIGV